MDKWMSEYIVPNRRQMTKERYERAIKTHILPDLGAIQSVDLTPKHLQSLEAKLSKQGMAPAGVKLIHNIISGALKYALRMEVVWRNVAQAVTPPNLDAEEVEPPNIDGVKKILEYAEAEGHSLFPCIHLIAYTGMRRGEALGLRWQDVNFEAGAIDIAQSLSRSVEKGLIFQAPKTKSGRRVIDLDDDTVAVLRAHQGKQLLYKTELNGAFEENGLVFPNQLGGPLNPLAVTRAYQSYAKRLGITGAKIHDLRHFHASVMLQSGQTLLLVSKRLGHASVATTGDIYGHLLPGWQKDAAIAFAEAMKKG
jgi:integrase